ncbi:hypothetical protein ACFQH2_17730 [Natronoarchaeum sp. GCM10025703]|uniref:hypothetical protein n=1 Tax=unclassified Natronoarchaeum TaxID=2620183 RepID=UPI00361C3AE4
MIQQNEKKQTNWNVEYDTVEPIRLRDPVAEALAVLGPGDPFVISYADVVKAAGHSCPTAAGAFRITQIGLGALYLEGIPVRGEIEVTMGGPKSDPTYGVLSRLVSYITGAAEEDGFAGLAGGYGGRDELLDFGELEADGPTVAFERTDTGDRVTVTYHVDEIPAAGPATQHLQKIIDGRETPEERAAFADEWHTRVQTILTDDDCFTVSTVRR